MSRFALERLDASHDRKQFQSGLESVDRYLRETAHSHTEKNIIITRVLVPSESSPPKPVLGYFTLAPCLVEAAAWPGPPEGLPRDPVGAILLGRLAVAESHRARATGLVSSRSARSISYHSIAAAGGIGLIVDAANEDLISFYEHYGFIRISPISTPLPAHGIPCSRSVFKLSAEWHGINQSRADIPVCPKHHRSPLGTGRNARPQECS